MVTTLVVITLKCIEISIHFPCGSAGKESACNVGDLGLIPGLGRSPGEGKGYPFQYSGLENSMDCIVQGVAKSRTQLSNFHFTCKIRGLPWRRTRGSPRSSSCLERKPPRAPQLEETPETPPSSRAEGLLFLHGLEDRKSVV